MAGFQIATESARKQLLMQYVSKGVGPQEFFTFMVPNENGFEKPEVRRNYGRGWKSVCCKLSRL